MTDSQFAAVLLSRIWARHHADRRGAKNAVVTGLIIAAVSGALYLFSLCYVGAPSLGFSSPLLGLIAGKAGQPAVFLTSTIVVLVSAIIALWMPLYRKNETGGAGSQEHRR